MQKITLVSVVVAVIVGIGIGYVFGMGNVRASRVGVHTMPDGTIMTDTGHSMDMADMMASMNAALEGKTGDAFDQAFISEMIVHHEGAVAMAELALMNAERQEIRDLAHAIIAAQNKEIADMRAWQESWYGQSY